MRTGTSFCAEKVEIRIVWKGKVKFSEARTCPTVTAWCHENFLPMLLPANLTASLMTSEISLSFQYFHSTVLKITTPISKTLKDKKGIVSFLDPSDELFSCLKTAINNARLKR